MKRPNAAGSHKGKASRLQPSHTDQAGAGPASPSKSKRRFQAFLEVQADFDRIELDAERLEAGYAVPERIVIQCPGCRGPLNGAKVTAKNEKTGRPTAVTCSNCGLTIPVRHYEIPKHVREEDT